MLQQTQDDCVLAPAVFAEEDPEHRAYLRKGMGILPWLKRRETFRVLPDGLHCEYYHHADDAPLLLFLPGIGTYCELYAELLARLSDAGYNVVGVDPFGHGHSPGERGTYTIEQMVHGLKQVITALKARGNGRVLIYGYSIGAVIALSLAEHDQRIDAVACGTLLLTEEAPDLVHRLGWNWIWGSAQLFPGWRLPLDSFINFEQLLGARPIGRFMDEDPLVIFDYPLSTLSNLYTHPCISITRRFDFKLMIIQGDEDEVLSLPYAKRVQRCLEQPCDLVVLSRQGHMLPWDAPQQLVSKLDQWFTENTQQD